MNTTLTTKLVEDIGDILCNCGDISLMLDVLEIDDRIFREWLRQGEKVYRKAIRTREIPPPDNMTTYELFCTVRKALARFEYDAINQLQEAATTEWRASLALLERRVSKRWGKRSLTKKIGKPKGLVEVPRTKIVGGINESALS